MGLFRRLFGRKTPENNRHEELILGLPSQASANYFATMGKMQEAIRTRNYERAAELVRDNLKQIPGWVREHCREYGSFDIRSIPAIEKGGRVLAFIGDDEGLVDMHNIVSSMPELRAWTKIVEEHQHDRHLFQAIIEAVRTHPNCLQTDIKNLIREEDARHVANLIAYIERAGKIVRIKTGCTHRLMLTGSKDIPPKPPKRIVQCHRKDRQPMKCFEVDLSSIPYVPLPHSPSNWTESQVNFLVDKVDYPEDFFVIHDTDWQVVSVEKIPFKERPDTAFRLMYPTQAGLLAIDDLGNAEDMGEIESAALRYDRSGNVAVKRALSHNVYRLSVHPCGHGLIAMSRECVLHAYDDNLELLFETQLADAPEIKALQKRFVIQNDQLKNHIRCVALSEDATRYLFTAVDEACCVDSSGQGLWHIKLPIKEGWERIATPSDKYGTSTDIQHALTLMGLSLPITPEEIKQRYRALAKQWHPDLHPNNPEAEQRMKEINAAAEMLTGIDANAFQRYAEKAQYRNVLKQTKIEMDGTKIVVNFIAGELLASDWIYAAAFAAGSDSVYLASYSGRIVHVDKNGKGLHAYDIGNIPTKIVDTGDYLYLLTGTRLYVIQDNKLHTLVDTFYSGDLVVAQTGFGLLEKKRLRWYRKDGTYLGSVDTKNPIRRVYSIPDGMVVETRQRRALIRGAPVWWEQQLRRTKINDQYPKGNCGSL